MYFNILFLFQKTGRVLPLAKKYVQGLATVNDVPTFLEDGYQLEVATSRAATLIGSLGDYVSFLAYPQTPPQKLTFRSATSRGDSTKNLQKTYKKPRRESRENARRLINMRYNLAFVCVSGIDSGLKIICLFSFLFVEWIFADFRLYYYKMRYNLASEPVCRGTRASTLSKPCIWGLEARLNI